MSLSNNFPTTPPSLNLDFANVKALDPRVTFTRSTTATYYDGVTVAMAEQNLLTYSQEFDNAAWVGSDATITSNSNVAPDGTTTAETMTLPGGVSNANKAQQGTTGQTATYTASVYARVTSGTGKLYLSLLDGAWGSSTITTCSLTTTWQRFTVSRTLTAGNSWFVVIGQTEASTDATTSIIWGAQLEQRSSVTAYTATTTQPITNYIPVLQTAASGIPRFDHNPTTSESLGLLIEQQSTNVVTNSASFSNWTKPNSSFSTEAIAPDGTLTAQKMISTVTGSNSGAYQSSSGATTISLYAKAAGKNWVSFINTSGSAFVAWFNVSTGTVGTVPAGYTATMTSVGNGWYRCVLTAASGSFAYHQWCICDQDNDTAVTANAINGVFVWGAQAEASLFATSYIPTTSAAATRAADFASMTGGNFTSWFNAGEGTFYGEANLSGGGRYFHTVKTGSSAQIEGVQQTGTFDAFVYTTTVEANIQIAAASFINRRVAMAYQVNDIAACVSGGTVSVDTNAILPLDLNAFYVNSYGTSGPLGSGTVKKVAYYPQRLTDAQLQALTS